MAISRRNLLKMGAGAGLTATIGKLGPLQAEALPTIYATIPSTGQKIPAVGVGTVNFRASSDSPALGQLGETLQVFHRAGGRLIDTSPNYGNSETVLGQLMREQGLRDDMFIATKVDREEREAGVGRMEDSFDLLGGDRIDLMQVHNLRGTDVQIATMREWKERGRFRYIGITTHRSGQYEDFERAMRKHKLDFIQVNYSIADRGAEQRILPLAQEQGLAVLVNRAFGRGRLFSAVGDKPLPGWAADFDASSWAQVFLKYVISHPAATIPIPGMTKPYHAADNMSAMTGRLPDAAIRREMERYIDAAL